MANIRMMDMPLIEGLFDMGSGYVLDFSNATFSQFFASELNVNIDDPAYSVNGGSKAKRLRTFLLAVEPGLAARTLLALWEYREFEHCFYASGAHDEGGGPRTGVAAKSPESPR